jgi:predicted transcriptional regulator
MQMRVMRSIPLEEVSRRVLDLEEKYGDDIEDIPDHFAAGRIDREAFEDYVDWIGMVHALRAYREGEDFDYFTEEVLELGWEQASKLTPRRIELLGHLSRHRVNSINDLASKIGRDVKNVYSDLKALDGLGFVRLVRDGKRIIPTLLVQEITILLW